MKPGSRAISGGERPRRQYGHRIRRTLLIALMAALVVDPAAAQAQTSEPRLAYTVRPEREGTEVTHLKVDLQITGPIDAGRPFTLKLPTTHLGRSGIADRIADLKLTDARGEVPLRVTDDAEKPSGFATLFRRWSAARPVEPPLSLSYTSRPTHYTRGPIYETYAVAGGVSGGGMHIYVLPETIGSASVDIGWDLSGLSQGSSFASSFSEGNFTFQGSPDRLWQSVFMAGRLGAYMPADETGWRMHWLGRLEFNPLDEFTWAHKAYKAWRSFFGDVTTPFYRGFAIAAGGGGGNGLYKSFIVTAPPGTENVTNPRNRIVMAHEMGHYFISVLDDGTGETMPNGERMAEGTFWFTEGLNMYYTRLVLLRVGLISADEYEADLSQWVQQYYGNAYRGYSNEALTRIGFSTGFGGQGDALSIPYSRGSLFWADVDARIRTRSKGKRSLDDVIVPLVSGRLNHGMHFNREKLLGALTAELGPSIRDHFNAVIERGALIAPPSAAFGPCFERHEKAYEVAGKVLHGYEWKRIASVPEDRCHTW